MSKLSAAQVKNAKNPGMLHDGSGLYLQVSKSGSKSWVYRYFSNGKSHDCGLGSYKALSLADAREAAQQCRKWRTQGIDPIKQRKQVRRAAMLEDAKAITFQAAAEKYIETHSSTWKTNRHTKKWGRALELYVYPVFGDIPVGEVDTDCVLRAIEPIWQTKNDTAGRVRGRIEQILDWARVRGYRDGENPARWKGNLQHALPPREKLLKTKHLKSLPYVELPDFWKKLKKRTTMAAEMLRFTILTASRTGDTRFATWGEVDWDNKIWTIPGERMKAGKEHRVPLAPAALDLLKALNNKRPDKDRRDDDLIFPNPKNGKAHSENAMLDVLDQMGFKGKFTVHGFRSTFKVWASEQTDYANELSELALAHTVSSAVEASYKRTSLVDKRRALMEDWADHFSR